MIIAKKRTIGRMLFFTCLAVLFFMTHLYAASTAQTPQKPVGANVSQTQKPVIAKPMPDLIVKEISLTGDCSIKFTIANIGLGGVPDAAYQNPSKAFLRMYDGTKSLGGISLQDADPYGHLKTAGGSEFGTALPGNYTPAGNHSLRIVIDEINIVKESNENNNGLTKALACAPPLQIKKLSIGSDAAGNCFVHIFLNKDGNKTLPLSAAKISFSNRSSWNKIEYGNAQFISLTSFKNSVPYNSTCPSYPCTIHVSIDSTFIKDLSGNALDGDYDGTPGGNFVQDIVVTNAASWGVFNH
ncbi:MAG: hypothetical protein EHM45_02995 [Desulfobacteraceae bacterium]|nr:MAG: hypothetical protein EHM45_02995 [Desulfobacteraceae bacterium]